MPKLCIFFLSLITLVTSPAQAADLARRPVAPPSAALEQVPEASAAPRRANTARPADLAVEDIKDGIDMQMGRVRSCYERALKSAPDLRGRLVVSFTIEADGTVEGAVVELDQLGVEPVAACVLDSVADLRFPASSRGADVQYPFLFRPQV